MENERASFIMQMVLARIKSQNSITERWPTRLKLQPKQPGAQEEFDALMAGNSNGTEVYLEWQRFK